MLFALAPIVESRSRASSPGRVRRVATSTCASVGTWPNGPPPDYVGWGVAVASFGALVAGRRRPLTWLLLLLAPTFCLAFGAYLLSGPGWLGHPWLPWRELSTLPVLKEILPDQFCRFSPCSWPS